MNTQHFSRNLSDISSKRSASTRSRLKLLIPRQYCQEPVLSNLTARCGLTVNITGAALRVESPGDGWFDVELWGTPQQIQSAITYLQELDIRVWGKPNPDGDGW